MKSPRPRWQWLGKCLEVLAYDLDAARLANGAVTRLAHYLTRRQQIPYEEAPTGRGI